MWVGEYVVYDKREWDGCTGAHKVAQRQIHDEKIRRRAQLPTQTKSNSIGLPLHTDDRVTENAFSFLVITLHTATRGNSAISSLPEDATDGSYKIQTKWQSVVAWAQITDSKLVAGLGSANSMKGLNRKCLALESRNPSVESQDWGKTALSRVAAWGMIIPDFNYTGLFHFLVISNIIYLDISLKQHLWFKNKK